MEMTESMTKCGQLLPAIVFQTALLQPEFHLFTFAELREAEQTTPQTDGGALLQPGAFAVLQQ